MKNTMVIFIVLILTACAPSASLPPTPSLTATLIPTVTPTPTLTPSPTPVPNGPCDNPLVPMVIGNEWRYLVTTPNGEKLYNLKAVDRQDSRNIVMLVEFGDGEGSVQEQVVCIDGAIDNFPLFMMDMLFTDYLNKLFNTYHDHGYYAPAHQTFADNDWMLNWEAEYLTEDVAYIKNPIGGSDLTVLESSPIFLSFEMDGTREPVTVPAGEFSQAIKVSHTFSLTVTVTLPTGGAGGHLTLFTTQWYEPYVGLVRTELESASLRTGTQEFSVPMQSIVELIEFTPGK